MNEETPPATDPTTQTSYSADLRIVGCGFAMGAADIVPGVSGGTVALILGVYERLITAITRCDSTFLKLVLRGQWPAAAEYIDLRFVAALAFGIAAGIGGLASLMNYLLINQMSLTFAAFTGMIIASSIIVARRIPKWNLQHAGLLLMGSVTALRLVTLPVLQDPPDTLWYLFLCGMVGITAMILPGISGAFILLLLSRYHFITESIKELVYWILDKVISMFTVIFNLSPVTTFQGGTGNINLTVIVALFVFGMGCVTGLLCFSRVLRWLLSRYHDGTMAVLCGFMLGSLYRLWPFQRDMTPDVEKFKHKTFENVFPDPGGSDVWLAAILCFSGIAVVLLLDAVGRRTHELRTADHQI